MSRRDVLGGMVNTLSDTFRLAAQRGPSLGWDTGSDAGSAMYLVLMFLLAVQDERSCSR